MSQLEDYFERGYIVSKVSQDIISRLWTEIYLADWIKDPENRYKEKPSWYYVKNYINDVHLRTEKLYSSEIMARAPASLIETAAEIIKKPEFDFLRTLNDSATVRYVHMWNGAEDISWHCDVVDGSDTMVFVYITDSVKWQDSWGGRLSLCKQLRGENLFETTVSPENGTMVIINNRNPLFKHQVERLKSLEINRYTFSLCYNWV